MMRVTLVGPAEDGQHLIVKNDAGQEFALPVTEELRAAVRHARGAAQAEARALTDVSGDRAAMSPKEIQQRIRGGLSAAELAQLTGQPVTSLEKFEAPVLAERAYVADLARSTRIGRDKGAPMLGDLVIDRLAARGVDSTALRWDAWREADTPWHVGVEFPMDGRTSRAVWTFDHTARAVTADDDESRWLTETELLDVPIPKRHLSSVKSGAGAAGGNAAASAENVRSLHGPRRSGQHGAAEGAVQDTESLLEDLQGKRGTRESVPTDDADDDFEGFGPAARTRSGDVGFKQRPSPPGHPAGTGLPAAEEPLPSDEPAPAKRAAKKGRASVPSWDEIVFGAKHE